MKTISTLIILSIGLMVSGCQTKPVNELSYTQQKAWAQTIAKKCLDQGIGYSHPEFKACLDAESRRDAAIKYNNRIRQQQVAHAMSQGFYNAGAAYNRAATSNTTTNCRSVRSPSGSINTTCY